LKDSRILYFLLVVVLDSKNLETKDSFVEIIKFWAKKNFNRKLKLNKFLVPFSQFCKN
jgi:hypothetical protein